MRRRESVDPDRTFDLCRFCYPSREESIVYENDSVYVMPSRGQFVEGYLLIVSKDHETCVADAVDDEFLTAKRAVGEALQQEYGSASFFEHGRTGSCYDRASNRICYHAHLHCLPVDDLSTAQVAADHGDPETVDTVRELDTLQKSSPHYLFVEPNDETGAFFAVDGQLERQYLRKRACEALGLPTSEADWRANPHEEAMARTADALRDRLTSPEASV